MKNLASSIVNAQSFQIYDSAIYTKDSLISSINSNSINIISVKQEADIDSMALQDYNLIDIASISLIDKVVGAVDKLNPNGGRIMANPDHDPGAQYSYYLTSYQLAGLLAGFISFLICLMAMCLTLDLQSPYGFRKEKLEFGRAQD